MKIGAFGWLVVVAAAALYLLVRAFGGIELQTDLMALLPQEERDTAVQRAKARMTEILGRRIILLVGHENRGTARAAGAELAQTLRHSGMTASVYYQADEATAREIGEVFFSHRSGLLTAADRARLIEGRAQEIVTRALVTLYGPVGLVDVNLLRRDPFLLVPAYLSELPLPLSRVSADEGMLSVTDGGKTFIVISAQLKGNAFALSFQDRFTTVLDGAEQQLLAGIPGLEVLRSGAVFYAHAGATVASNETSTIGLVSTLGTIGLILLVFRALRPLGFNVLALGVGVLCAFSASLWLFGSLHIGALLFGVSLIGVAVDYSLHYSCEGLESESSSPRDRIRRVLPGITLGLVTTLVGYLALLLAPFPGLHQLAVFSAVGLCASFLTVVLWLPLIDDDRPSQHARRFLDTAGRLWQFWEEPRFRRTRQVVIGAVVAVAAVGATTLTIDDDVRRLQALPDNLKRQEGEIRRLTGTGSSGQFFLINGQNREAVLQIEEALITRLDAAQRNGAVSQFYAVAQVVPSEFRQRENLNLIRERLLVPFLTSFYDRIGIHSGSAQQDEDRFLMPAAIAPGSPLSFFHNLMIEEDASGVSQLVLLDGVVRPDEIRRLGEGIAGVHFIDPTGDFSRLFGEYRRRAVWLLALSAALMMPILLWRYGLRGGFQVLLPSATALLLTPPLVALGGAPFTFFNAIALLLVLAISIDYAIFCKESRSGRRSETMLGIWLATLTTILSFGLLALSSVYGVHAFGMTLAVGISLSFFLSPLAGQERAIDDVRKDPRRPATWSEAP